MFNSDPNNPDSLIEDIAEVGLLTTAAPLFGKASRYYNENLSDTFSNWGTKLPGSDYLVNQMNKTINTASGQLLSTEGQSLSKTMLSMLMTAEEMSPLHILRTLQLSNLIQPFVELEQSNEIIHLTGRQIRGQEAYYKALLDYAQTENKNKVKRQLLVKDLTKGMFYHKGNIYGSTKTGTIDKNDLILRDARLVLGSQTNGEIHSPNHILEKFSNLIGGKLNSRELRSNPLTIVAGSSSKQFGLDWTKSTLRFAAEVGFKTLDNPLAGIEEMLHGVGVNYTGLFENKYYKAVKDRLQTLDKIDNIETGRYYFDNGEVSFDKEDMRVKVFFDVKPDEKTRDELKSRGFKWSPKNSAWQRKLTPNAIYITKRMFKDIGSLEIKLVNDYTKTI